jgi:hypothetical protein
VIDMKRALLLCLCLVLGAACKSKDNVPVAPTGTGTGEPSDNGDASQTTDVPEADAGVDLLAPTVSFISPAAASDPNADTVITDVDLTVHCRVTRSSATGSAKVDSSKVTITLDNPEDSAKPITSTVSALSDEEYTATFELNAVPNGPLRFHCQAQDQATKPHIGKAKLDTLLDLGPTISLISPKEMGIYTLQTPVSIEFQVTPSGLGSDDNEQAVQHVLLQIGGVETPVEESTTTPGLYKTSIDFGDRSNFPVPPTSAQIAVSASDARTPMAATRKITADIVIDGQGPTITIMSPHNQSIVHGNVTLLVNVTDSSGIKPGSLSADVGGTLTITNWKGSPPMYSQTFDTRDQMYFPNTLTQLTINVTASDAVGNLSTAAWLLKLDNLPPLIGLDPPDVIEARTSGDSVFCSVPFDPVGKHAASDLSKVLSSTYFRALIEDKTNKSPGAVVRYLAGINDSKVALYVQPDPSVPLLIDTDNDKLHACDEINLNPLDHPEKHPVTQPLAPVNPGGKAPYNPKPAFTPVPGCPFDPTFDDPKFDDMGNVLPTDAVCKNSDMFRVLPASDVQGKPPAIYAFLPSNDTGNGECTGTNLELTALGVTHNGWICVAARAEDKIENTSDATMINGNIGVSAPLRLCYGNFDDQKKTCEGAAAPSCTDGCVITDAQRWPSGMIWPADN